ncbi:MAG: acyltransferase domain-containing protein, partial [Frankia sp.]
LPATLHAATPSSHVDWTDGTVSLLTEKHEWAISEEGAGVRRAAVSSFGISGTNAHVILEQAPTAEPTAPTAVQDIHGPTRWLVTAKSRAGLATQAGKLADHLEGLSEWDPAQVAVALTNKPLFTHRAAITGTTGEALVGGLRTLAAEEVSPSVVVGQATGPGKIAFCYSGQGSQRLGMGKELYDTYPAYRDAFDQACAALDPHLPQPVTSVVFGDDPDLLNQTRWTQTSLFAFHHALTRLLADHGVRPHALIGHSIGQLSAAHTAGVLDLDQAAKLVAARATLMQNAPSGGHMVNIAANPDELDPILQAHPDVSIAAINSPGNTVIAGDPDQTADIAAQFEDKGRRTRRLTVSHAFHSPHMDSILREFQQVADTVDFHGPTLPIISNGTGAWATEEELTTPHTWTDHIRNTVHYAHGITTLQENGTTHYLEIGPDTTLTTLTTASLTEQTDALAIPTLHPTKSDTTTLTTALGTLATTLATPPAATASGDVDPIDLPTYAFAREPFWLTTPPASGDVTASGLSPASHPLLASLTAGPDGALTATGSLTRTTLPWIADHAIAGTVVLPATALVDLALHLGQQTGHPHLDELTLHAPLVLDDAPVRLHLTVAPPEEDSDGSTRTLALHTHPAGDDHNDDDHNDTGWTLHTTGTLTTRPAGPPPRVDTSTWPPRGARPGPEPVALYPTLADLGYDYGPTFANLVSDETVGSGDQLVHYATVELPADLPTDGHTVHPALLDAALHPLVHEGAEAGATPLPFSVGGVQLFSTDATTARVTITPTGPNAVSMLVTDPAGEPILTIASLVMRPVELARLFEASPRSRSAAGSLLRVEWQEVATPGSAGARAGAWAVVGDVDPGPLELDGPTRHRDLDGLIAAVADGQTAPAVVLLGPVAGDEDLDVPSRAHAATAALLGALRSLVAAPALEAGHLSVLTSRAVAVDA